VESCAKPKTERPAIRSAPPRAPPGRARLPIRSEQDARPDQLQRALVPQQAQALERAQRPEVIARDVVGVGDVAVGDGAEVVGASFTLCPSSV
jgi:hypothetical protein